MKINILGYILIAFVLIIAYRIFQDSEYLNLKCIISDVDGKRYCVRERSKMTLAADLLAKINVKMNKLVKYLGEKYPDRENIKRLVKGYNPKKNVYKQKPFREPEESIKPKSPVMPF